MRQKTRGRSRKLRLLGLLLALLMVIPVSASDMRAEGGELWEGLGSLNFDFDFETAEPEDDDELAAVDVNTTSAGVETSANAQVEPTNSGVVHQVNNNSLLQMFLMGQLGGNNDIFEFSGELTAPATAVQGRPGVFTGTVRGNATISGLRLAPRANAATPGAAYRNDIGFIRLLGHGARIEGLTFADAQFNDGAGISDWNVIVGNIGLVAGRVGAESTVTIENVTVRGATAGTNASFTVGGGSRAYSNKRVGGLVGALDGGSTLTINNPNVRFAVNSTVTGGTSGATGTGAGARNIPAVGGLIGLTAGNTNITGGSVYLQTALTGTVRYLHVGGAIGQSSGTTNISNFTSLGMADTATNRLEQLGHGNRETSQGGSTAIGNRSVGGFIGSMNGSVTFRGATNQANISVTQGRIGGFIGRTQGAGQTRIYSSTNLGRIWNSLPTGNGRNRISSSGGFIGQADGTVYIENSVNGSPTATGAAADVLGAVRVNGRQGAGGFIGITAARGGSETRLVNVRNHGHIQSYGSRRYVGGFIGHARNAVHITDTSATNAVLGPSTNYGRVRIHNLNNASGTPNNAGGFIGVATNTVNITNGINRGTIEASGAEAWAPGGRLRLGGFIGLSSNRVTVNTATNHANIWSGPNNNATSGDVGRQHTGSEFGGIIGRAEFRGVRANRIVELNDVTNHGDIGYNLLGVWRAAGRTGGIVGFSAHRVGAFGLNINGALNTGNIRSNVGTGASNTNRSNLMAAGGIVGTLDTLNSTLNNVVNIGNVTGGGINAEANNRSTVGGIVGRASRNNLTITNSGNEGVVRNNGTTSISHHINQGAGGVIGTITRGNNTRILRTYNAGSVEGSSQSTGGIVGSVRRRGTLLIEDVYNAGSVMGRQASAGAGNLAQSGNGILGFRRNTGSVFTFRNVINTGNVHGSPIFDHNVARATNANLNTHARFQNRMSYQGVYFDSSVHTGRPQLMTIGAPGRRQREVTGLHGVTTSVLTSGGLHEFQSPNWLTRGWISSWVDNRYDDWETYPWLSWQTAGITPAVTRGEDYPEFFEWIRPGADHEVIANQTPIEFNNIGAGSTHIAGGHTVDAVRNVRTFIPYGPRVANQAAGSATIHHRAHMPRSPGTLTGISVNRNVGDALSVGLISPRGVIGFNGNERFNDVVVMGVDGPHYREEPSRTTVITWSRMTLDGIPVTTHSGILGLESIEVGQRIDITASPGYLPAHRIITQADVTHFETHGSLLIRVPMERAPMHIRVALVDSTREFASGEHEGHLMQIEANRNPQARTGPEGTTPEAIMALPPLPLCPTGNLDYHGPPVPPTSVFSTSHLYPEAVHWFDEINGVADRFLGVQINLWINDIVNPYAAGTAADPFFVIIPLECIELEGDLFLVRNFEDEDGASHDYALPHGGRVTTTQANPAHSNFFELEFRNPPLVAGSPTALAGTGTANATGGRLGTWNAEGELIGAGPVASGANRNNSVWEVRNATYLTEVRAVQRTPGQPIPGNGLGRTYRATPWVSLGGIAEHHATTEALIYMLLDLDHEYHVQVNVYERIPVLPGVYEEIPLTDPLPSLYHDKDRGIDGLPLYNWNHVRLPQNYRFHPVRVHEGEALIARATGFAETTVYASVGVNADGNPDPMPSERHVIPIVMERAQAGRLTGFVLPDLLRTDPDLLNPGSDNPNHRPIPNAAVVLIDENGYIRNTTSGTNPSGFFYFEGLPAGEYTLFATHPEWGAHITIPTPVVIPEVPGSAVGGNATATIFLDDDTEAGFLLLIDVINLANNENISSDATAVLTYGTPPTVRESTYYSPFRRLNLDARGTPMNWEEGSLHVSATGFNNVTIEPVYDEVIRPVPGAQFGRITVHLGPTHTLEVANAPDPEGDATRRPAPTGQGATATHTSPHVADRTLLEAPATFGETHQGARRPSTFDDVVAGSSITLNAGASEGWTFLGWYTQSQLDAHFAANPPDAVLPPPAHGTGAIHTFNLIGNAHWVAVWGNQDRIPFVPNDYMLTINNVPEYLVEGVVTIPAGQTLTGERYFGQAIALQPGSREADDLEFLGWWQGGNVPRPGDNTDDFEDSPNFVPANGTHTFTMPASDITYTALWGCDEGYVGGRFNLTIDNRPPYPVAGPPSAPEGQEPSGTVVRSAGEVITLVPGTRADDDLEFLGWWIGANVPGLGVNVSTLVNNANFIAPSITTFVMPARNETLTALWGRGGVIGGEFELTVNNVPPYLVSGNVTTPQGQAPTSSPPLRNAGEVINLASGSRSADSLEFLGWWLGTEDVPTQGTYIGDLADHPSFRPVGTPSFIMPAHNETLTALWGLDEIIGGNNLLIVNNMPEYLVDGVVRRPTGQTASGERDFGEAISLVSGSRVADDLEFIGWWRGANVPGPGTNLEDFEDSPYFVPANGTHNFNMPASGITYTALWGDDGYVGGRFNLTINNRPPYPVVGPPSAPEGQVPSGIRSAGEEIALVPGTRADDDLEFLGWWIGANVPGLGVNVSTLVGNANFIAPSITTFVMPARDETLTALWGRDGVIGGEFELTVNNVPPYIVSGNVTTPQGQAPTSSPPLRNAGEVINLASGSRSADSLEFLGWWLGTEDVPTQGTYIGDLVDHPSFRPVGTPSFIMPAHNETLTALWGLDNIIGGNNLLIVNNMPEYLVDGVVTRPTGQTASGERDFGEAISLVSGIRVADDLEFIGWWRGANVPGPGTNIEDFEDSPYFVPANGTHNFSMPASGITYTALWGADGDVGGRFNLTINNRPPYPVVGPPSTPAGQVPSGIRSAGEVITLVPGTRADDNLEFLGWWIGANVPGLGVNVSTLVGNANFIAPSITTFVMPARNETLTALWGVDGIIGGEFVLTVNNLPPYLVSGDVTAPQGQAPTSSPPLRNAGEVINLVPGSRSADTLEFLGWWIGTEDIPRQGTYIGDLTGHPSFRPVGTPSFIMPAHNETLTALWGLDNIIGGNNILTVNNMPEYLVDGVVTRPTGQTPSGERYFGEGVFLLPGSRTADDLEFIGWWRGANVPGPGTNLEDFEDDPNFVPVNGTYNFSMPASGITYTALWGDDGYVGGRFNLTVDNRPPYPVTGTPSAPEGQEPSGTSIRSAGEEITLVPGTRADDDLEFLGWWIGANVPGLGVNVSTLVGNANFIAPSVTTFVMPARDETLTALWGRDGVIGGEFELTVNNVPPYIVSGNVTTPQGQAPTSSPPLRNAGEVINLASGSRSADSLEFLGWWLGTEDVPTQGTYIGDLVDHPSFRPVATTSFIMPAHDETLTALWGLGDIIGGNNLLIVNNMPEYLVNGVVTRPTGQTASGERDFGEAISLVSGSRAADDLEFIGWWRGANVPEPGTNLEDFEDSPYFVPANGTHNFNMPASGITYTALWGDDGYVGGRFNLTINNRPPYPVVGPPSTPAGQEPSGTTIRSAGEVITLVPGTRADDNLDFLGWWIGANVPGLGVDVSTLAGNANFIAPSTTTFIMPARNETLTALWGRDGVIGGEFELTVNNLPPYLVSGDVTIPQGQAPTSSPPLRNAGEVINLVPGSRAADNLEFLGWWLGTEDVPGQGTYIGDIADHPSFRPVGTPSFIMPAHNETLTALWGLDDIIGGNNILTVNNMPEYLVDGVVTRPEGQTPSGERYFGEAVFLLPGSREADELEFFGWWRGANVPEPGTNIEDFEDDPNFVPVNGTYNFSMPASGITYTALWGDDGYVGGRFSLTVDNRPPYPLVGPPSTPEGQEPSGTSIRSAGEEITLVPGTRSDDDLEFLGWWIGANVPGLGVDVSTLVGNANFIAPSITTFIMPARDETLTALWGRDGIIGGDFELTVNNVPVYLVSGNVTVPTGQVPFGTSTRNAGAQINLNPGSRVADDLVFLGWWVGVEDVPSPGTYIGDLIGHANFLPTSTTTFIMPARDETLTALWGIGDITGRQNLIIDNLPDKTPPPVGQSASRIVEVGAELPPLNEGAAGDDWTFLGWTADRAGLEAFLADWDEEDPATWQDALDADVIVELPTIMTVEAVRATAVWGNDAGEIGTPNSNLIIDNLPDKTPPPLGQTASRIVEVGAELPQLNEGDAGEDWTFLGWTADRAGLEAFLADWDEEDPATWQDALDANVIVDLPTTMPETVVRATAVWGDSRGVIGTPDPPFTITFHLYTPNQAIWDAFEDYTTGVVNGRPVVVVPVTPGTASATWDGLEEALGIGHIYGVPGTPGHAFWGWLTDDTLDASDRVNANTGLRRPSLGDECEVEDVIADVEDGVEAVITELFGSATRGNLDLFAVWSLWGDVDDDDEVTMEDVELLRRFIQYTPIGHVILLNSQAANVLIGDALDMEDAELIRRFVQYGHIMEVILGVRVQQ